MDFYRPICRHFIIPAWAIYENTPYLRHLKYLLQSQYYDEALIKEKQWHSIKKVIRHAYENTKFYHQHFKKENIHPEDIKSFDDFAKIPLLKKEDVRNNEAKMFAHNYDKYIRFFTSGSTGVPLAGFRDKRCHEFKRACGVRSSLWSGYNLGERVYCVYGDPEKEITWRKKVRRKLLTRERFLNSLELTDDSMMNFANTMRKKPPSLIWGHAHNIYILAIFLERKRIYDIKPKGMFSAGMVLHKWERDKIEKVFNCVFQDRYGCEEIGLIAAECKKKEGLHINTDDLFLEFIDKDGKAVPSGTPGQIIVTDLNNYVMPFIRYKMEDIGLHTDRKCSCGITQPLIEKIEGRIADFLITPQGKAVSGISLTDHFGANIPGVFQIQIIQEKSDFLVLNIVKDKSFNENSIKQIESLVRLFFSDTMKFECKYFEKIPQEASGKFRFTICKIENPFMK